MSLLYETIRARDVRAGDRVNRARTRAFFEVQSVTRANGIVEIIFVEAGVARPRENSIWWRQVSA